MYYVAHRLFAAHDRALAAHLAHELALRVGEGHVFLPFCDTDEEDLVAEVKGRRLFELDRDRLRTLRALIAIVHGPSLDDGVCMEIGYAAALRIPILLMTTDFQDYSTTPAGPRTCFPEPLLDTLATRTVRVPRLGVPPGDPGQTRYTAFADRNRAQVQRAITTCVDAVLQLPAPKRTVIPAGRGAPSTPSPRRTHRPRGCGASSPSTGSPRSIRPASTTRIPSRPPEPTGQQHATRAASSSTPPAPRPRREQPS